MRPVCPTPELLAKALSSGSRYTGVSMRALFLAATMAVLLAGCSFMSPSVRRALTTPYKPVNVARLQAVLPESIRRVALLPIPRSRADANQTAGAEALEPLFLIELNKRNAFEVIPVSPERVHALTGGSAWGADDRLPADFLEKLRKATGCDAVIFLSLTTFQPYPPLVIIMTGKLDAVDPILARKIGADDFVVKTSDMAVLLQAVRKIFLPT